MQISGKLRLYCADSKELGEHTDRICNEYLREQWSRTTEDTTESRARAEFQESSHTHGEKRRTAP